MNIANLLWGFDILKPIGLDGKVIEPDMNALKPVRHPSFPLLPKLTHNSLQQQLVLVTPPFECDIRPRSPRHADIIRQNFINGASTCVPFEQELNEEDTKFVAGLREQAATELRPAKV